MARKVVFHSSSLEYKPKSKRSRARMQGWDWHFQVFYKDTQGREKEFLSGYNYPDQISAENDAARALKRADSMERINSGDNIVFDNPRRQTMGRNPWKPQDAPRHTRLATTPQLKRQWADVANSALEQGHSEARAIQMADGILKHGKKSNPSHLENWDPRDLQRAIDRTVKWLEANKDKEGTWRHDEYLLYLWDLERAMDVVTRKAPSSRNPHFLSHDLPPDLHEISDALAEEMTPEEAKEFAVTLLQDAGAVEEAAAVNEVLAGAEVQSNPSIFNTTSYHVIWEPTRLSESTGRGLRAGTDSFPTWDEAKKLAERKRGDGYNVIIQNYEGDLLWHNGYLSTLREKSRGGTRSNPTSTVEKVNFRHWRYVLKVDHQELYQPNSLKEGLELRRKYRKDYPTHDVDLYRVILEDGILQEIKLP